MFLHLLTRWVNPPPPMPAPTTPSTTSHLHPPTQAPQLSKPAQNPTNESLVGFSHGRRLKRPPTSHCDSLGGFSPTHHLHSPSTHLPRPSALEKGPATHQQFVGGSPTRTQVIYQYLGSVRRRAIYGRRIWGLKLGSAQAA